MQVTIKTVCKIDESKVIKLISGDSKNTLSLEDGIFTGAMTESDFNDMMNAFRNNVEVVLDKVTIRADEKTYVITCDWYTNDDDDQDFNIIKEIKS